MLKYHIIPPLLLCSFAGFAQTNWANRLGAWNNDAFNAIVVDAAGNSYVTGEFGGSVVVQGQTLASQGSLDIVVARYGPTGTLLWAQGFGGPGMDRGIALALGPGGTLAVTGQFMGTVSFGGDVLVSQGGTQDMFVALLNAADGAVLWARQGGGADGVDQPNGVSVGPNGSVVVTGEFRGTAVFDGGTITSMMDPDTQLPSVDIFVAAYSAIGTALWLKHGAAKKADRGMAVAHDPAGNVYVTGQFSDTLTFDQTHNNNMFSAVFLVRFDPTGAEDWFRVFGGGVYNQVFAMQVVGGDRLMLCGDIQGTVIFLDSQPDMFTAVAPRSSFLMEVNLAGEFIRQTTWGSDNILNTRAMSVQGNEVAVLGRFQCQFTGFSAMHGEGTWLATGPHDLYLARFDLDDLAFKDAQQFGGQREKVPGGIGHMPDGAPVFVGAFDGRLVFPSRLGAFQTWPAQHLVEAPPSTPGFCDDPDYGQYICLRGVSLMDAFIARGLCEGRAPYDAFLRQGGDCERPLPEMYIRMNGQGQPGADTLQACNMAVLRPNTFTAFVQDTSSKHTAPAFTFLWQNGSDSIQIPATQTGWYHVTVTSPMNCRSWTDSLYVIIHPLPPPPLISDDVVVNTETSLPAHISVCEPQMPWLWATGLPPDHTVAWTGPQDLSGVDSIQASVTGQYMVQFTSPAGCISQRAVHVYINPSGELPPLEAVYDIVFPQDLDLNDTLELCTNIQLRWAAQVGIQLDGQNTSLPYGVRILRRCNGGGWSSNQGLSPLCGTFIETEGWHSFSIDIILTNAPCGEDTLYFSRTDSIYVVPFVPVAPIATITGPPYLCPGDTATLVLDCINCTQVNWSGPWIVENAIDSIRLVGPGNYTAQVQHTDTNGCIKTVNKHHLIQWNPNPLLSVVPSDGIICPDSSATITSSMVGADYAWYGPLGPLDVDAHMITTSQQGFYYLELVDTLGCHVTSDPILITDYATPYLNVLPDNALCSPGDQATLHVITTGQPTLQWWTPLYGNALQQVVQQPGIYTCAVTGCGITTILSTEIFGDLAVAELADPGPYLICPDDELLLEALPGDNLFTYWLPDSVISGSITVTTPGTWTLVGVDVNGCTTSLQVTVEQAGFTVPLSVSDTIICAGDPVVLNADGTGILTWYADAGLTQLIGNGSQLVMGAQYGDFSVFLLQEEQPCVSGVAELAVHVPTFPGALLISGPDTVCAGQEILLEATQQDGVLYQWTTPLGGWTGNVLQVSEASQGDDGQYVVVASDGQCLLDSAAHALTVLVLQIPDLGPDTAFCIGGAYQLEVPPDFTEPLWSTGSTSWSIVVTSAGNYTLEAIDPQGCPVLGMVYLDAIDCHALVPNVLTPNGDGVNDMWQLGDGPFKSALFKVYDRWGTSVWQGDPSRVPFRAVHSNGEPLAAGTYFWTLELHSYQEAMTVQQGTIMILR